MDSQDGSPSSDLPKVDTGEFYFDGTGLSALLIHGLTGTPYEMRYLGERLAAAGVRVRGVRLAGHAGEPHELGAATHEHWYESVVQGFEELRRFGDPNVAIGLSMGALLAARLAEDQREAIAALVILAPAFFLQPGLTLALKAAGLLGRFASRIYFHNERGSDIHDQAARFIHPSCRLMPLSAPLELFKLSALVRRKLARVSQPALIIHSERDHTCPCAKNVGYVMEHLGSVQKRPVILKESYHVITVDSEKERVASETIEFVNGFRAAPQKRHAAG